MHTISLDKRVTRRYRDGWDYLDQWTPTGLHARLTPPRTVAVGWDGWTTLQTAILPAGLTRRQRAVALDALTDTLSGSDCTHEHDCCGCISRWVDIVPGRNKRRWTVRVRGSRNI